MLKAMWREALLLCISLHKAQDPKPLWARITQAECPRQAEGLHPWLWCHLCSEDLQRQ